MLTKEKLSSITKRAKEHYESERMASEDSYQEYERTHKNELL